MAREEWSRPPSGARMLGLGCSPSVDPSRGKRDGGKFQGGRQNIKSHETERLKKISSRPRPGPRGACERQSQCDSGETQAGPVPHRLSSSRMHVHITSMPVLHSGCHERIRFAISCWVRAGPRAYDPRKDVQNRRQRLSTAVMCWVLVFYSTKVAYLGKRLFGVSGNKWLVSSPKGVAEMVI